MASFVKQLSAISLQLSVISLQLSAFSYQLSAFSYQLWQMGTNIVFLRFDFPRG